MDSVIVVIQSILQGHVAGVKVLYLVAIAVGTFFPVLVGIILPRRHTIGYGRAINKFLGLALLQKRVYGKVDVTNMFQAIILTIQATFQDVSFGVYIDSRKDLTEEEKKKKTEEYLGVTPPKDPIPPAGNP